jgi:hypothetical protein
VLVVLASRADPAARLLAERLGGDALLLTPLDLSAPGWRLDPFRPGNSTFVVGGRKFRERALSGIVTLLPCVFEQELVHIQLGDRRYVAAEMTAFLTCWLAGLRCPRLNAPTAGCLSGPNWRPERWIRHATATGLPTTPVQVSTTKGLHDRSGRARTVGVTVIGERCVGHRSENLQEAARQLARAAELDLLHVEFEVGRGVPRVAGATPFPDLSTLEAAEAVRGYFDGWPA